MSRIAVFSAVFLLAVIVFSGAIVWNGLSDGDGFASNASANDGYYITEVRQAAH